MKRATGLARACPRPAHNRYILQLVFVFFFAAFIRFCCSSIIPLVFIESDPATVSRSRMPRWNVLLSDRCWMGFISSFALCLRSRSPLSGRDVSQWRHPLCCSAFVFESDIILGRSSHPFICHAPVQVRTSTTIPYPQRNPSNNKLKIKLFSTIVFGSYRLVGFFFAPLARERKILNLNQIYISQDLTERRCISFILKTDFICHINCGLDVRKNDTVSFRHFCCCCSRWESSFPTVYIKWLGKLFGEKKIRFVKLEQQPPPPFAHSFRIQTRPQCETESK